MIPLVEAGGTPGDIGRTVGRELSTLLGKAAEEMARRWEARVGWRDGLRWAAALVPAARRAFPRAVEELEGMAEGSGVPFLELFIQNAGQEVGALARGCTSLGIPPEGTRDGGVLLAHNEDASPWETPYSYVVRGRPDGAPAYVAFTYVGALLHQGFNAAGIGQVGNALYPTDIRPGAPKLLAYREALYADFLEQAIRTATHPERGNGNNHLLASAEGEVYDVEVSGTRHALLHAGTRPLVHTNHFVAPEMRDLEAGDTLNSQLRRNRVAHLLDAGYGRWTAEGLLRVLADHANYPKAVCKHEDAVNNPAVRTIGAVVIDLGARRLLACQGYPCEATFREVRLDEEPLPEGGRVATRGATATPPRRRAAARLAGVRRPDAVGT